MSYTSTPEQDAVINWQGSKLVVNAFAGTGKTSTLVRFAEANPECKILYLAYNRAVRDEAERKFPSNVECKTSHQLAWPQSGRHFRLEQADRLWLTSSFRFGSEVAQMANLLLEGAGEKIKITGCGGDDEVLTQLPAGTPHVAVLSRTISGVIGSALRASMAGKKVYWVGGIEGYRSEELEDLYWFSADMPERMHSPRLSSDYRDFREYCQVAKATGDAEMNQAIRLLDEFFPLPQKLAIMRGHVVTDEKNAQVTVCTAHRSKGLEWPVVMLNEDFFDITDPLLSAEERQDEINLLYVAVTRARRTLVLNELLCWLKDNDGQNVTQN